MISAAPHKWAAAVGLQAQRIARGSPWKYGYCESFNGKLRDECLRQEFFYSVREVQIGVGHVHQRPTTFVAG